MGMKPRKPRGVVMMATRDRADRVVVGIFCAANHGNCALEAEWPGPKLKPGECRKVRVIIEEVE